MQAPDPRLGAPELAAHWWSTTRTVSAGYRVGQPAAPAGGGLSTLLPPAPQD